MAAMPFLFCTRMLKVLFMFAAWGAWKSNTFMQCAKAVKNGKKEQKKV